MITTGRSTTTRAGRRPRFERRPGGRRAPRGPALAIDGPSGRELVPIPVGWSAIGRSPAAAIRLDDPGVARRHALIVRSVDDDLQIIEDRGPGETYLNDEPVRWAELDDGDELRIGAVRLTVRTGAGSRA